MGDATVTAYLEEQGQFTDAWDEDAETNPDASPAAEGLKEAGRSSSGRSREELSSSNPDAIKIYLREIRKTPLLTFADMACPNRIPRPWKASVARSYSPASG